MLTQRSGDVEPTQFFRIIYFGRSGMLTHLQGINCSQNCEPVDVFATHQIPGGTLKPKC